MEGALRPGRYAARADSPQEGFTPGMARDNPPVGPRLSGWLNYASIEDSAVAGRRHRHGDCGASRPGTTLVKRGR